MVSQALTGTAPEPCGSPEPRPATPPVWGSACQITNCDRRRWTLSRSIMSSCKLGPKNSFLSYTHSPSHISFHFNFQISLIPFHFLPFLFHFIPIGCLSARGRVLNSIPSNRHSGRSIYLLTTLTTLVVLRPCTVASSMKVLYPAVMCAHRRELVFVHTSLSRPVGDFHVIREDTLDEWVPASYLARGHPLLQPLLDDQHGHGISASLLQALGLRRRDPAPLRPGPLRRRSR